jgi:hypothetical protein
MDPGSFKESEIYVATQQMVRVSESGLNIASEERDIKNTAPTQKLISSIEPLLASQGIGESKVIVRHPTVSIELSDSDSESNEDIEDDDMDDDEWSGVNNNIEDTLYEAVYPDVELAAYMISKMYPTLLLSYEKKIAKKVSSWQERNITTCGTSSGSANTTKDVAPQTGSSIGNRSSPKHHRQSSSLDDSIGDDEDDEADDSRRKRSKEELSNDSVIPRPRFACPFYKYDPVKYSPVQSHRKSCAGPGWVTIAQLK